MIFLHVKECPLQLEIYMIVHSQGFQGGLFPSCRDKKWQRMAYFLLKVCSCKLTWTAARTKDSDPEKLVTTNHTSSTFSIIETWIVTVFLWDTRPPSPLFSDFQKNVTIPWCPKNVTSLSEFIDLSSYDSASLDSVMRLLSYSERHFGSRKGQADMVYVFPT